MALRASAGEKIDPVQPRAELYEAIFEPKGIAVIGASRSATSFGLRVVKLLKRYDYLGNVFPVNPNYTSVGGWRAYPNVAALPEVPGLAVVAVPKEAVVDVVRECGAIGVRAAVVFSGGFAELDEAGIVR